MTKTETLALFNKSKKYHELQMSKMRRLVDERNIDNPTPNDKTKCDFGLWLYGDEKRLKKLIGLVFYRKIEAYHSQWHDEYAKVYNLFYINDQTMKDPSQMDVDKAKLYVSEMEESSQKILEYMNSSLKRLNALSEERFS